MSESILKALMRLFAIIANFDEDDVTESGRSVVESYLKQQLNQNQTNEYLQIFDEYYALHHSKKGKKRLSANSVKVLAICEQVNEELRQEQKILVLLQLLEFISFGGTVTDLEEEFVQTVADTFNIDKDEYINAKTFILKDIEAVPQKDKLLVINNNQSSTHPEIKHIYNENLTGQISVLHLSATNIFIFLYDGQSDLTLNGQHVRTNWAYIFVKGASIRGPKVNPIYYSDLTSKFLYTGDKSRIVFNALNIDFKFKNSPNGIQKFTFSAETGELIGVMGGSGAGKSTLLNVFNGSLRPQKGAITINGLNINDAGDKLEGVIGFVPQDDLLIEELTVYQNLYYNAKLCFDDYTKEQIDEAVTKVLQDLDLYEIRHLKVGSPLRKFISGGQRKRVNIALELIREPSILFVDEPTSGLSSMDSDMVMDLLKEITLKGKLVITNIHQPSSDIYKMFDKLLIMDKGGHPVYSGNPVDAVVYFKKMTNHINADESECPRCGNVNPEQVLEIVEAKVVDEYGKLTRSRKVSPQEWYSLFQENLESKQEVKECKEPIPDNPFKIPNKIKQFFIFTTRDVLSKLTNRQYLLINFLEAPALAFILGYFTKYLAGTPEDPNAYVFAENANLAGYLFMSVVVALFLGMTVSAEEIIKDRRILKRESFLNLSKTSYLNSKVMLMFFISAVQTLSFAFVGNMILEIKGMTIPFFFMLFTTSCFANIVGLNISAALDSVVTIYILIPFILVPQLLLSGTIVKFEKLHKSITHEVFVPIVGDLMTSRWAYEGMAVYQFKNNKYQKNFFDIDMRKSNAGFKTNFLIPELRQKINKIEKNFEKKKKENKEETERYLRIVRNEFDLLKKDKNIPAFSKYDELNMKSFSPETAEAALKYLKAINQEFKDRYNKAVREKDQKIKDLIKEQDGDENALHEMRQKYYNENLADLVLNKTELKKIRETENRVMQTMDPIYKMPESNYGRAHFFAPFKIIGNIKIDTYWFNAMIIWLTTIFMYIILLLDGIRKLIDLSGKIKVKGLFGKKKE